MVWAALGMGGVLIHTNCSQTFFKACVCISLEAPASGGGFSGSIHVADCREACTGPRGRWAVPVTASQPP